MTTKKVRPEPAAALLDYLANRTKEIAVLYKDALKQEPQAKLSEKAQKLQDLVNARDFGCYGEKVAEAFSILTGETIKPKPESPRLDPGHGRTNGLCITLNSLNYPLEAGLIYIRVPNGWMRADTGGVKDGTTSPRLDSFAFADAKAVREALRKMPKDKQRLLTLALL